MSEITTTLERAPLLPPLPVETVISAERTVAFFADRRAAQLLLTATVDQLIVSMHIQRGLVDLSSIPGLAIAAAFERAGIPYESIEFGQERVYETVSDADPLQSPFTEADADRFRALAAGETKLDISELGTINANIVLVPAATAPNEKLADFSPQTITGVLLQQVEDLGRPLILIDIPERGLWVGFDGTYLRPTMHVDGTKGAV